MTYNKRKKNIRQRAKTTHGWGSMKKHRGKGNKGGAGNAGTGKRGDAKKPTIWKNKKYFGKYGFKKKGIKIKINSININELQLQLHKFKKEGDTYKIDLSALGYNKLLGAGSVTKKMNIKTDYASEKAISKVKEKGGEVSIQKED